MVLGVKKKHTQKKTPYDNNNISTSVGCKSEFL